MFVGMDGKLIENYSHFNRLIEGNSRDDHIREIFKKKFNWSNKSKNSNLKILKLRKLFRGHW